MTVINVRFCNLREPGIRSRTGSAPSRISGIDLLMLLRLAAAVLFLVFCADNSAFGTPQAEGRPVHRVVTPPVVIAEEEGTALLGGATGVELMLSVFGENRDVRRIHSDALAQQFIELTVDQRRSLDAIRSEAARELGLVVAKYGNAVPTPAMEDLDVELRPIAERLAEKTRAVVLPVQLMALDDFDLYLRVQSHGFSNAMIDGVLGAGLSDEERESIRSKAGEVRARILKEARALERGAISELISGIAVEKQRRILHVYDMFPNSLMPDFRGLFAFPGSGDCPVPAKK